MEGMILRKSAIVLARVLGFIEIADLLSGAGMSVPNMVERLTAKYSFQKFPNRFEELDAGKGIEFLEGASGDHPIKKLAIWETLIVLETRISTDVSKLIMEEILLWASKEFSLKYQPGLIKRFGYISDVTFFSDAPLLDVHPAVLNLARKASEELSHIWQEPVEYMPSTVKVGHDPTSRKFPIAPFLIEHRSEARFSENKYFSEAPLPTKLHWEMLEQYEKDIMLHSAKALRI